MKKKRFSPAGKRHISCSSNYSQGVRVSVGVTVKPKRFLPFLFLRSKGLPRPQPRSQSRSRSLSHPHSFSIFHLPPSIILFFSLLFLPSCKDVGVPPDRIVADTTNHGPDTTSHNFMWTIDTLGDGASSVLNDVAIVNDTLIYAVGEIYLKDSTGQIDPLRYNLAIWNGTKWTLQRLPYNYQGQQFVHPIQAVFDKGADDIWFGGNGVIHWNGIQFVEMQIGR